MQDVGYKTSLRRREFLRSISAVGAMTAWEGLGDMPKVDAIGYDGTLRDGCWLYGHDSGDHDGLGNNPMNHYNVPMSSELPVAEAAREFGLKNVCVCRWGHADDAYLSQYRDLKRVSWAITGSRNTRYPTLLEHNFALLDKLPNLVAFDLDDYFRSSGVDERIITSSGEVTSARAALPYFELQRLRRRMCARKDRSLALQLVVYDYMLREEMRPVFDSVDVVQYWTWCGKDIRDLTQRFRRYRQLAPGKPTFLGIYMWDYGNRRPLELAFMKQQLQVGFDLWRRGEVQGLVFHCSNLLNKNLPPAEYARDWFAEHANATRDQASFHEVALRPETALGAGFVNVPDLSVRNDRLRQLRAEMDRDGRRNVALRVGGDEWLPFAGSMNRQLLACGKDRVMVIEQSGRVVWKHEGCGMVYAARIDGRQVYFSNGRLNRLPVVLPCNPRAAAEVVYRGPTGADDVRGFDFTMDGTIVAAAGEYVVELDPLTFVPRTWIHAGKGALMAHKTRNGSYLAIFDDAVREFNEQGAQLAEIRIDGGGIGDAIRMSGGKTLIACGEEIREYTAKSQSKVIFASARVPGLKGARFASLQRLADGGMVVGVAWKGTSIDSPRLAALGIAQNQALEWSVSSALDAGMPSAMQIQSREEYD